MAAVPERDAGVGSAVNDVSRQLGGALGVAVIGSVVSSAYRANLRGALPAGLQPGVGRSAAKSIGVAAQTAKSLPPDAAAALTRAPYTAYVDAITRGFLISAIVMTAALVAAGDTPPAADARRTSRSRPARRARRARRDAADAAGAGLRGVEALAPESA